MDSTVTSLIDEARAARGWLFSASDAIKIVGVAQKYLRPGVIPNAIPEYTNSYLDADPGSDNAYHLTPIDFWTCGFFPGSIWTLVERARLLKEKSALAKYSDNELITLAQAWSEGIKDFVYPALDHDQGFRVCPTFYAAYNLEVDPEDNKALVISAAQSLMDRFSPVVGATRSWSQCQDGDTFYDPEKLDEHFLVIIDNMMNLGLLYAATTLTGDKSFAEAADKHAETTARSHTREDGGTCHVVNFDPKTGAILGKFAHQGYEEESTWSRGQAWGIYGFAECAQHSGRSDFIQTSQLLADKFLDCLTEDGVPYWDFDAPRPCPRDASAAMVAACGLLKLYHLLLVLNKSKAEYYLKQALRLVENTLKMCRTGAASVGSDGRVDFGEGGWETILKHSTINGNKHARPKRMDHGLCYADYYFLQFGNELLKLNRDGFTL